MTGTKPLLLTPTTVGAIELAHRIVMCPLTRRRANESGVPSPHAAEYYTQRATPGGLIITEGTFIAAEAGGMANVPEQILAWQAITESVHSVGGKIFCQLWALGRSASPSLVSKVFAPSDIPLPPDGVHSTTLARLSPMTVEDIDRFIGHYRQAALNAIEAGFDGVEIHGANGYLIDQFLQSNTNNRTDYYGGSVENRLRFPLHVLEAICSAIGPERVGIRISPFSNWQGMRMSQPLETFVPWTHEIAKLKVAYVHAVEPRATGLSDTPEADLRLEDSLDPIRKILISTNVSFIVAGGYSPLNVVQHAEETGDLVAFGRHFISNPDLVHRLKNNWPLAEYVRPSFYTQGVEGYTDYPKYATEG